MDKNYLFFDIECCNSYLQDSKICSFGYVLTDNEFNIVKEEDIFINPVGKFKLTNRNNQDDIKLKYPEEFFRKQKKFTYYYITIKELLENPNNVIVGYSTSNDVRFILSELLFFQLDPINFNYYDVQEIFDSELKYDRRVSLNDASEVLGLNKQDDAHDSLSDAISTMNICKTLCNNLKLGVEELLNKYKSKRFKDYHLLDEVDEPIRVLSSFRLYKYYVVKHKAPIPYVNKKKFCFSNQLEKNYIARMINLYKKVADGGGIYNSKVSECDFFVSSDEQDENEIRYVIANDNKIPIINYSKFISIVGTTTEELDEMNPLTDLVKRIEPNPWIENRILIINENKKSKPTSLGDIFSDFFNDLKSK